jgi:murein DD-endopeptidase MepM/ murein hydrolase activator NlpD
VSEASDADSPRGSGGWWALGVVVASPLVIIAIILFTVVAVLGAGHGDAAACTPGSAVQAGATTAGGGGGTVSIPNGWGPRVDEAAAVSGVPAAVLAAQLNAESGWNPKATSPVGAQGLAQFMPGTWAIYGQGDPFDPIAAIKAQGKYMKALMDQVQPVAKTSGADPVSLALAAYNAGPGAVLLSRGIPPFAETQNYVKKILGSGQVSYSAGCGVPGGSTIGTLSGKWTDPLPGAIMTSPYGPRPAPPGTAGGALAFFHYGIDFSTPGGPGTVLAVTDLKITVATDVDGGTGSGTHVKAQTLDGKLSIGFYHMQPGSLRVKAGDTVSAGTPLGTEGASGNVTGRHLHMEFFPGKFDNPWVPINTTTDPLPILHQQGVRL